MNLTPDLVRALAPTGVLRAAINTGNPILASAGDAPGVAQGVSVDLAQGLAQRLGVAVSLVVMDTAGKSVEAVAREQADVGFFAVDPLRGESIAFTAPYVLIEGCYAVRADSPLQANEEVDRPGTRVVVGQGSAYDLFLSRTLQHASLLRVASSPAVIEEFIAQQAEVAAGVKQQIEADARRVGGLRLLPGRFMLIQQAMACPRSRGPEAAALLAAYVEDMKRKGFVAQALQRHGVQGAGLAPLLEGGAAM